MSAIVPLATLDPASAGAEAQRPRLAAGPADIAALRAKVAVAPWDAVWARVRKAADARLGEMPELPPRGGNWSHNDVCPEHGVAVKQGTRTGPWAWEHSCPVGPHALVSERKRATHDFDGGSIRRVHDAMASDAIQHGLIYQVTGDARHAARGRALLLAYAARYSTYELHDNQGRPGKGARVCSQSLSEAVWLARMAQAADLVWASCSDEERQRLADGLFRAALHDVILPSHFGIHNIQCHLNKAIGLVGYLLDDAALVARAIDGPVGFRAQVREGIREDGIWLEGAWGYHFYTLDGLLPLAEAARQAGTDLYSGKLKRMFDAPLALAMPNGVLPAFNDSREVVLASQARFYEYAYARYGDARYLPLLRAQERSGSDALLVGVAALPPVAPAEAPAATNLSASGYAVLAQGTGADGAWLCLKYGPHGGGHGHPDKLSFVLFARGALLMPDAGTKAYGSPLHGSWDKTTLAHNTLLVDGRDQKPATGKCLAYRSAPDAAYVQADAGPAVDGVRHVRTVALLDSSVALVIDQVRCDRERQLEIVCHMRGSWQELPPGVAWNPPAQPGYRWIELATIRSASEQTSLRLRDTQDRATTLEVAAHAGTPTEIITGTGVGANTSDRVPLAILRRRATHTAFVWAVGLTDEKVGLRSLSLHDSSGNACEASEATAVEVSCGGRVWHVVANPDTRALRGDSQTAVTAERVEIIPVAAATSSSSRSGSPAAR